MAHKPTTHDRLNFCDPQSWAYRLVVGTFALVVVVCIGTMSYQSMTGRGSVSPEMKETLKDAMLVLAGLLARSSQQATGTQSVHVENPASDPVPVEEKK